MAALTVDPRAESASPAPLSKKRKCYELDELASLALASSPAPTAGQDPANEAPPSKRQKTEVNRSIYDKAKELADIAVLHVRMSTWSDAVVKQLSALETEFMAGIGVSNKQQRQVVILAEMKKIVEEIGGVSLQSKRQLHLDLLKEVPALSTKVKQILERSGFADNQALLADVETLSQSIRTAASPFVGEDREKFATTKMALIKRAEAIQDKMSRLMIKVNLPRNDEQFNTGNARTSRQVDAETKSKFDIDKSGGIFVGILLNKPLSKEWFHLQEGDPILFTMKGKLRPVAFVHQTEAVDDVSSFIL